MTQEHNSVFFFLVNFVSKKTEVWWFAPVIPVTGEVEIRRTVVSRAAWAKSF